jgi:hypothetical protein
VFVSGYFVFYVTKTDSNQEIFQTGFDFSSSLNFEKSTLVSK